MGKKFAVDELPRLSLSYSNYLKCVTAGRFQATAAIMARMSFATKTMILVILNSSNTV